MKIDTLFPPPPQHKQPPLRCDDIPAARLRALHRLSSFAAAAEACIGMPLEGDLPFAGTARGFCLFALRSSPFAEEVAELLARKRISLVAEGHVDADRVMLIEPRRYWGVLGPVRGDAVLFSDGHVAVVTLPLCMGCQHFEAVSLSSSEGPPQIVKRTHWLSTVKWIVRLVDESEWSAQELAVQEAEKAAAQEPQAAEGGADTPVRSDSAPDMVSPEASLETENSEPPTENSEPVAKRKRRITGV